MPSFSSTNKTINLILPEFYQDLVNQKEYEIILTKSIKEVERIGQVISVNDGTITIKSPDEEVDELHFHLDNLVRKCRNADKADWEEIIEDHFQRFDRNRSKQEYINKDFDFARDLLVVQVRPVGTISESDLSDFVYREDIPHTHTFLTLQYDGAFHFVRKDEIGEWEKQEEELFETGLANIPREEIEVEEYLMQNEYEMFVFYSGDFSASFMLELEKNASYAVGQFGSVVSIPAKGTAFVHPINGKTALGFINTIADMRQEIYNEEPAPISEKFYWYYQQRFFEFSEEELEDAISISYPQELSDLLENNF